MARVQVMSQHRLQRLYQQHMGRQHCLRDRGGSLRGAHLYSCEGAGVVSIVDEADAATGAGLVGQHSHAQNRAVRREELVQIQPVGLSDMVPIGAQQASATRAVWQQGVVPQSDRLQSGPVDVVHTGRAPQEADSSRICWLAVLCWQKRSCCRPDPAEQPAGRSCVWPKCACMCLRIACANLLQCVHKLCMPARPGVFASSCNCTVPQAILGC